MARAGVRQVTVIPGDGVGPEVVAATCRVLEATGVPFAWDPQTVGVLAFERSGSALPDQVLTSVRRNGVALKGPVATPAHAQFRSVNLALRRALDLYVQVRPCRSFVGAPGPYPDISITVVREATEDLYAGVEMTSGSPEAQSLVEWLAGHGHDLSAAAGFSIKYVTEQAVRRATRFAVGLARQQELDRLTVIHKATVMRATDGLFLDVACEEAESLGLATEPVSVDTAAAMMVSRPERLPLLLAPNLYGDILADLAGAMVGGIGLVPGANYGDGIAVFEAAHGTAPRHAGKGDANPMALILSGALLLEHIDEQEAAHRVRAAVAAVIEDGSSCSYDLRRPGDPRPPVGTAGVADAVIERLTAQG